MRKVLIFTFLFCTVLALSACGRNNQPAEEDRAPQSLTISTHVNYHGYARIAAGRLQDELAEMGIDFSFEVIAFTWDDVHEHILAQQSLIYMGQGADVFIFTPWHPLWAFIDNGLLADINPLVNAYANRDDFFAHILEAMEIDGSLYVFPMDFAYEFVGVNANLPQPFLDRFAGYGSISFENLALFYNDLIDQHPEFNHLAMGFGMPVMSAVQDQVNSMVDWGARTVLAPEASFTGFLENVQRATQNIDRYNTREDMNEMWAVPAGRRMLALQQQRYVFTISSNRNQANALLAFEAPYFVHHIPIATAAGDIGAWDVWGSGRSPLAGINANADGTLAWKFLRHLLTARTQGLSAGLSMATPIVRDLSQVQVQNTLMRSMEQPGLQPFGVGGAQINEAIARLSALHEMPAEIPATLFLLPASIYAHTISDLIAGEISPEQAAQKIYTQVSAWMAETRELEVDMQWVHNQAERDGLPERSLSVLGFEWFENVLRQAEAAMNADWALRGMEYNFNLDFSSYNFNTMTAAQARLQAALMAGQGYDIFLQCYDQPLWAWSESGLIRDIWTLIDADPGLSRDDFYVNVLSAYERNGRLFALPVSFGFMYASINMELPQSIISRFAVYDTITTSQLLAIYLSLMEEYPEEFGHMYFGGSVWKVSTPFDLIATAMGDFIDLDARSANLTDSRFVDFMELVRQAFPGINMRSGISFQGGDMTIRGGDHDFSRERAFWVYAERLGPAHAMLSHYDPVFYHHIPITDEHGRLLINSAPLGFGTNVWTTLIYPTTGNGELAWEFTQHLMRAMVNPIGVGQYGQGGRYGNWGPSSLATPILRTYFETQVTQALESVIDFSRRPTRPSGWEYIGTDTPEGRAEVLDGVLSRLGAYNEMPVTIAPFFSQDFRERTMDEIDAFLRGNVSALDTAQLLQNRVTLWLIE